MVDVMPVQVLSADGTGQDSDIIAGLVWAADHGADVAVMAFSNPGYSQALQDAVNYAWNHGVVVVAAAGNDGATTPNYPAGDAKVVGVGATDQNDQLWSGSNASNAVFLTAPGVDIKADSVGGGTDSVTGTSMSAAIVAGAAAQLVAVDPYASPGEIVGRLARNADPDGGVGNGRVNEARSLNDSSTVPVVPAGAPGGGPIAGPYVSAARSIEVTINGTGSGSVTISASAGNISFSTTGSNACTGSGNNSPSVTISTTCTSLSSSNNGATVTLSAAASGSSYFTGWSNQIGDFASCTGTASCANVLSGGQNKITATINTKKTITPSFSASNKVYDGTNAHCHLHGVFAGHR